MSTELIAIPTPQDISDLVTAWQDVYSERVTNTYKYRGLEVDILSRTMDDPTKKNNKLAHDFRGKIVRMMVGYLFGKPVTYVLDRERYTGGADSAEYKKDNEELDYFLLRSEIADLDSETAKDAGNTGTAGRLCYIGTDGLVGVARVPSYECLFPTDSATLSTYQSNGGERWLDDEEALRIYQVTVNGTSVWHVEYYGQYYRAAYRQVGDAYELVSEPELHLFDYCPLIEFPYNEERQGAWIAVESLIDAYDRTRSDAQNEHEEFRNAYLFGQGMVIDADTAIAARAAGAFSSEEPDADLKFVTKNINDAFLENHTKRLKDDIFNLADSVDTSDEKFSGAAQSGASRKWKLVGLENSASLYERKFRASTHRQFRCLCSAWQKQGFKLDWRSIDFEVDRNVPVELLEEAQVQAALMGVVTDQTRLGLASFVPDPVREAQRLEEQSSVNLDGFTDQNTDANADAGGQV